MGLPVWREPSPEDAAPKFTSDPTAHDRSAIRRVERVRTTSSASRRIELGQRTQRAQRRRRLEAELATLEAPNNMARLDPTTEAGERARIGLGLQPTSLVSAQAQAIRAATGMAEPRRHYRGEAVRPRSRRGPTSQDLDEMPPLRRHGRRSLAQEMDDSQYGARVAEGVRNQRNIERHFGGLGDRQRSWSPDGESDAWAVMGSTIEPDPSLPSASTSFNTQTRSAEEDVEIERQRRIERHISEHPRRITSFFLPAIDDPVTGQPLGEQELREQELRERGEAERRERINEALDRQEERDLDPERPRQNNIRPIFSTRRTTDARQRSPPIRQPTQREPGSRMRGSPESEDEEPEQVVAYDSAADCPGEEAAEIRNRNIDPMARNVVGQIAGFVDTWHHRGAGATVDALVEIEGVLARADPRDLRMDGRPADFVDPDGDLIH